MYRKFLHDLRLHPEHKAHSHWFMSPHERPLPEPIRRALDAVTLDHKYSLNVGRAFMSSVQAPVKLPMLSGAACGRA